MTKKQDELKKQMYKIVDDIVEKDDEVYETLTAKDETCANCGHDLTNDPDYHYSKYCVVCECGHESISHRRAVKPLLISNCRNSKCSCKKFVAKSGTHSPQQAKEFLLPKDVEYPHGVGAEDTFAGDDLK